MSNLYYIGLIPDEELNSLCVAYKNQAEELFTCKAAKKSPAHITIVPPFEIDSSNMELINQELSELVKNYTTLELAIHGWNHFKERTIYLAIEATPQLKQMFTEVYDRVIHYVTPRGDRKFIPHISIINRDLAPENFTAAYDFFNQKPLPAKCICSKLVLFSLVNGKWRNSISYNLV